MFLLSAGGSPIRQNRGFKENLKQNLKLIVLPFLSFLKHSFGAGSIRWATAGLEPKNRLAWMCLFYKNGIYDKTSEKTIVKIKTVMAAPTTPGKKNNYNLFLIN